MDVTSRVMVDDSSRAADVQATFCSTLVDEWARLGVSHAMIAPGSRSTPMSLAIASDPRWTISMFHDERSASFAALGYGVSSERPAVLLCTSGTAAAHFHAAIVEADLSGVPLIAITADRPPESQDVGAPQTIRQNGLFASAVRWDHDPGVPVASASSSWRSLARRCVGASLGEPAGPVHLNLPFREPLVGEPAELPAAEATHVEANGRRRLDGESRREVIRRLDVRRPLLVVGRGATRQLVDVAISRGWPVVAESRQRSSAEVITHVDSLVRCPEFADSHVPDLVVRVGEAPASKVFGQWLVRHAVEQIHVSTDGRIFDPDHRISMRVRTGADDLATLIGELSTGVDGKWNEEWSHAERSARVAVSSELVTLGIDHGVSAIAAFVEALPDDAALVVSSSMPIRDVEWFAGPLGNRFVVANRGANGIDGVIATAIGVGLHRGGPVGVVIGDVAMLHDSSSLAGLARRGVDLRILVVDNDGGGIFHHLPQVETVDANTFEMLYGTPHGTDFVALATAHGLPAAIARDIDELVSGASRPGPSLSVVRTDRPGDVAAHRRLHAAVAASLRNL